MDQIHNLIMILYVACLLSAGLAGLDVSQSPTSLTVLQGNQAKLSCFFSAADPTMKGSVSWHKAGLQGNISSSRLLPLRVRFSLTFPRTFLSEGDGSLVISNVTWVDAGTYFCKVFTWDQEEEQGNGTRLLVYAHPSQPEIYLQVTTKSTEEVGFICRTSGFYPPDIGLTWHTTDVVLPDSGPLEITKSEAGVYQATLHLILPSSFRYKLLTVTCIIQHVSLTKPLYSNFTYSLSENGLSGYQLVGYLNILKISLILGLTFCMLLTVRKRCNHK